MGDHPRVCGEHSSTAFSQTSRVGSSPRMRGALGDLDRAQHVVGIIPAYAGSTGPSRDRPRRPRDHPRVCGEHRPCPTVGGSRPGSSPRMRGAPRAVHARAGWAGIIPAYAGSTRLSYPGRRVSRDHPRVCGEHSASAVSVSAAQGSSPRMRGARHDLPCPSSPHGIIPAYAGSTQASPC